MGVQSVTLQRLVYFGTGLATEDQSVFGAHSDEDEVERQIQACQRTADSVGVELQGSGRLAPADSVRAIDSQRPWSGCTRPWRSTYVTANGNVLPCCIAPFATRDYEGLILGNAFEQPIKEIWSGSRYQAFRSAHASERPPEACLGCGSRWMY
jgi:radical SAM protein with 4Fe4S-binding SPASM domain